MVNNSALEALTNYRKLVVKRLDGYKELIVSQDEGHFKDYLLSCIRLTQGSLHEVNNTIEELK